MLVMFGGSMVKTLERNWILISIGLFIILLISMFLLPHIIYSLALLVIIINVGMAIYFIVMDQIQAKRYNKISTKKVILNIAIKIIGGALAIILALLIAGVLSRIIYYWILEKAIMYSWSVIGIKIANLVGVLIVLFVGIVIGIITQWLWKRITKI